MMAMNTPWPELLPAQANDSAAKKCVYCPCYSSPYCWYHIYTFSGIASFPGTYLSQSIATAHANFRLDPVLGL